MRSLVRPALRSRSQRRVHKRVPSGESRVFYDRSYSYVAHCSICGKPLGGVPRDLRLIRHGAKTEKRPERPYGGTLCPSCLVLAYKVVLRGIG